HRLHGLQSDTAVGAIGVEAERSQAPLDFLHFRQRWRPFAARKSLHKGLAAKNAVAEMTDGERIIHRRIVALHRFEILPDQEGRTAGDRHPELRRSAWHGIGFAVGTDHTKLLPRGIAARAICTVRGTHLITPRLAAPIAAALQE